MYTEQSTTGINLIDLTRREAMLLSDSLRRAMHHCVISNEERRVMLDMMNKLNLVIAEDKLKTIKP